MLVTDMLNRYEHDDAEPLMASVRVALPQVAELIAHARRRELPVIYVNDNHGDWSAGREQLVEWGLGGADPSLIGPIEPAPDAPFLTKARHSAFYQTLLAELLHQRGIERLVLCGQVTEQCILYTALDAYVRHYEVVVASDAVAHIDAVLADAALEMMARNMHAKIAPAARSLD